MMIKAVYMVKIIHLMKVVHLLMIKTADKIQVEHLMSSLAARALIIPHHLKVKVPPEAVAQRSF